MYTCHQVTVASGISCIMFTIILDIQVEVISGD